jgi:protoheme IX farnesyltransferase
MSSSVMIARPSVAPATGPPPGIRSVADDFVAGSAEFSAQEAGKSTAAGVVPRSGRLAVLTDLWELTKPRIVMMILVTTAIAAMIAGVTSETAGPLGWLLLGVGLVAGSAGAMNQVWEQRLDGRMVRTRQRPLPAGRLSWSVGFAFSTAIGLLGLVLLAVKLGPIPMALALATWLVYVPIYTPLKTRSQWNTTVGAVSGALPMLVGFTGGGGSLADPIGWLLVGVLVAWQYPHFMAIAWLVRKEYAGAGFRMATTDDPSGRSAGWQSVVGMIFLSLCLAALVWLLVPASPAMAALLTATVLATTYPMIRAAWRFAGRRDDLTARRLLRASLWQLPASLSLLMFAAWYGGA